MALENPIEPSFPSAANSGSFCSSARGMLPAVGTRLKTRASWLPFSAMALPAMIVNQHHQQQIQLLTFVGQRGDGLACLVRLDHAFVAMDALDEACDVFD